MVQNTTEKKLIYIISKPIYVYIIFFSTTFFLLSSLGVWLQLNGFRTAESDTFWFTNIFYNTIHGNGFFYPSPNQYNITQEYPAYSHFHQHNQPILFLILPFYYLFPSVYTLFFLQSIVMGAAAVPLYLIGKEKLDEISAKMIAISFLLYPVVMWSILTFHPISFSPFFIFLLIYAYMKEKLGLFYLSLFLCLFLKENLPLLLFPLGIYLLYDSYKEKRFSQNRKYQYILPLLILTPIYFLFSFKVIIPHFTSGGYVFFAERYSHLGRSFSEILINLIKKPDLFINEIISKKTASYILQLLLPVSFVPLLSISTFSVGIPILMQNLFSNFSGQTYFITHYHFELISVIFLSVIVSFSKIKKNKNLFEEFRIRYFYLVLFWSVIFSFIRVLIFISPKPLY